MLLSVECAGRVRRRPRPGRAGRARRWGSERLPRIDCPGMGWVAIGIAAGRKRPQPSGTVLHTLALSCSPLAVCAVSCADLELAASQPPSASCLVPRHAALLMLCV